MRSIKFALLGALSIVVLGLVVGSQASRSNPIEDFEIRTTVPIEDIQLKKETAKQKTYPVKRINTESDNTIYLIEDVNYQSSLRVVNEIKRKEEKGKDLFLLIDSPGGSVVDGLRVVSAIEGSKSRVNTVCIRLCASMGFIIHQYGHKRLNVNRSILMAHHASGGARGEIPNMLSLLGTIQRIVDKTNAYIANRAGITQEAMNTLVVNDMWLDAEDSVNKGFSDGLVVVGELPEPDVGILFDEHKKTPTHRTPTTLEEIQMVLK